MLVSPTEMFPIDFVKDGLGDKTPKVKKSLSSIDKIDNEMMTDHIVSLFYLGKGIGYMGNRYRVGAMGT